MDPSIQAQPGYYFWELPDKPVVVQLRLDVVDRLSAEVMRGFGAVPKRGAEVGGLLLGTIEQGARTIIRVEDFEPVPCDYKRGPSYLFSSHDGAEFASACEHWRPDPARAMYAVGYFRSNTRESLTLTPADLVLMEEYFWSPSQVALLIRPFATKVSVASFFFRDEGGFQTKAPLEFPFRRRELTGEDPPPRRAMLERVPRNRGARNIQPPEQEHEEPHDVIPASPPPVYGYAAPGKPRVRSRWLWLPLSFVFLLLGIALGFLVAMSLGPRAIGEPIDYSLGLTVIKDGDNLSVKWDRDASAVKSAQKGLLEIEDGGKTKPIDLDAAQLRNGSLLFTNSTGTVRFKLTVYPQPKITVIQTAEWRSGK